MTTTYTGVIPPVLTPLTEDGTVDRDSLERLVQHLLDGGVDGLFALGSSGETVFLTDEQRDEALEVIVHTAAGAVPVMAGCIEPTTPRVLERLRAAERFGADATVVTAPFYAIVGPHEIERHLRAVASASSLPVVAYDIPVCVGRKLPLDLLLRLAGEGVLAGVKDSSGDDVAFRQLRIGLDDQGDSTFSLLTGHELVVDGMLLAGASGSVPGLGNVDPAGYVRLHSYAGKQDWAAARAEQERLARLFRIVDAADPATAAGATRGVGAFKTAAHLLGIIDSPTVSLPMRGYDEAETGRVREQLELAGLDVRR
ncbi:dihydrodipicolinate synthase family protein [Flexivirga endophytica]|uniref:Dihydrodipicolinate synthase family protein n=1 Tax=Flexivirga endophytica TaxID=1849103 RepID=A0A916TGX9_9MICO|nr:dihydrodipicolinate synthase family protein [Flexivirga endophytica]GGB44292.1 dihydrodipicolinate synthase family protein [Flexivirga endophytica]GHB60197.1 dihydrodipicolinate synthase family protein [Flexivirga endophytica]